MEFGLFMMPLHPPYRSYSDSYDRDLELLVEADRLWYRRSDPVADPPGELMSSSRARYRLLRAMESNIRAYTGSRTRVPMTPYTSTTATPARLRKNNGMLQTP